MSTPKNTKSTLGKSWLVPLFGFILQVTKWLSVYHWVVWRMKKVGRWPNDESTPFWFAEAYAVVFPAITFSLFMVSDGSGSIWLYIAAILATYRLFDLGHGLFSIVFYEMQMEGRKDHLGHYIAVRHAVRWLLLAFINLFDLVISFGVLYRLFGTNFYPSIETKVDALYQACATFTTLAGGQAAPNSQFGKLVVMGHLAYMLFFFVLIVPIVLSVIRGREVKEDNLGNDGGKDPRY